MQACSAISPFLSETGAISKNAPGWESQRQQHGTSVLLWPVFQQLPPVSKKINIIVGKIPFFAETAVAK
ncbi:MAG: hypothetical protein Q4G39_04180 [Brachymonas sp.]|nr:hypothetical protein [Brachymonas sp.]